MSLRHRLSVDDVQNLVISRCCFAQEGKECKEIYQAQLLFCSLNLLFSDVLVAVVVVLCLSSLV